MSRGRPRVRVIGGLCLRGHLLTQTNTYRMQHSKTGSRYLRCATCQSEDARSLYRERVMAHKADHRQP